MKATTFAAVLIGVLLASLAIFAVLLWQEPTHPRPCQIFEVCE